MILFITSKSDSPSFLFWFKIPFISFENSIGFWQNNGSYTKGSYDSSIKLKYKVKFLTLNLKFTMNFDF